MNDTDRIIILRAMLRYFVITWILIIIAIATGCTDNRIRTAPTLDSRYKNPELRLHMTREMWAQTQLRHYEDEEND